MPDVAYLHKTTEVGREGHEAYSEPFYFRFTWSSVIAGVILAMIVQTALALLGIGIGLSIVNPVQSGSVTGLSIGQAIWWVVSGIISIFIGGMIASRFSNAETRNDGGIYGIVTWALASIIMLYAVTSTLGAIVSGGVGVLGQGLGTAVGVGAAASNQQGGGVLGSFTNQLQSSLGLQNLHLNAQQSQEVMSASTDLLKDPNNQSARQRLSNVLTQGGMNPGQADQNINQMLQTYNQFSASAKNAAAEASNAIGRAGIWSFIMLLLGAISSYFGGVYGMMLRPVQANIAQLK